MARNLVAVFAACSAALVFAILAQLAWYLICYVSMPERFNVPTPRLPYWFFAGVVLIDGGKGAITGLVLVALAKKPAKLFVFLMLLGMAVSTFVLTQSGFIAAIWIPVWVGHVRRVVMCACFWYAARWLGMRLAAREGRYGFNGTLAW